MLAYIFAKEIEMDLKSRHELIVVNCAENMLRRSFGGSFGPASASAIFELVAPLLRLKQENTRFGATLISSLCCSSKISNWVSGTFWGTFWKYSKTGVLQIPDQ